MQEEFAPVQQSLMQWVFAALGVRYTLLLPIVAIVCLFLIIAIIIRGRGAMAAVALLLIVHTPIFVGIFAAIEGLIASYSVISMSPTTPKPSEVATGISMSLVAPAIAMLLTIPSYAVASVGAFIRCMLSGDDTAKHQYKT